MISLTDLLAAQDRSLSRAVALAAALADALERFELVSREIDKRIADELRMAPV